jgi:2-polyprenyl-3-methyl-5-hydroxy-6-metoxy-1,4-benzoquinol methylase
MRLSAPPYFGGSYVKDQDFELYADLKRFNTAIAPTWDMALNEVLQCVMRPPEQVRLLDYGCGDGKYYAHLLSKGLSSDLVHGADVSRRRIERCLQIGWHNARVLVPGASLPYEDGMFDIVNCMEVIEHIPFAQCEKTVRELRRVLRPGGVLLISTPNYPIKRFYDLCDAVLHGKFIRLRDDPTHVTRFDHQRLTRLLQDSFARVETRDFKPGFLYKHYPRPFLLHKLFFLCQP